MSRALASLVLVSVLVWVMVLASGCGPAEGQASTTTSNHNFPPVRTIETTPVPVSASAAEIPEWVKTRVSLKIDAMMVDFSTVRSLEQMIRTQLGLFEKRKGSVWSPGPDPDHAWSALLGSSLQRPPENPFSPDNVATHVTVLREPGLTGDQVSPRVAGWAWNTADEILYAARDAAAIRACAREEDRRIRLDRAGPLLRQKLTMLRAQINFFIIYEGVSPWEAGNIDGRQWRPLIERGYVSHPPMNPMVPHSVSTRIVEVRRTGLTGTAIDPETAAWVWNSADYKIYAAGFDGSL
jgi:hypothetical protein